MADRKQNADRPAQDRPEHASPRDREQDRLPDGAHEPEPANGPSLTVAHLRKAAARLHPQFGSPLIKALDALRLASDLWSLYPFAWMTRVDFSDGITTWMLIRDKEGRWKRDDDYERRGGGKGVVPLDAAFFYADIVEGLQKLKTQLRSSPVALPRHSLGIDAATAIFQKVLPGGDLSKPPNGPGGGRHALGAPDAAPPPKDEGTKQQGAPPISAVAAGPASPCGARGNQHRHSSPWANLVDPVGTAARET